MKGFILTRQWRDTPTGIVIECWLSTDNGPVQLTIPNQQSVFFIRQVDADNYAYLFASPRSARVSPHSFIQVKSLDLKNSKGKKFVAFIAVSISKLKNYFVNVINIM